MSLTTVPEKWQLAIMPLSATLRDAISNLDKVAIKIVMIINENNELEGTILDGDIRRGLLKGLSLDCPVSSVLHRNPLVVPKEMPKDAVMQLMLVNKIHQIPVVDERNGIVGLHLWDKISEPPSRSNMMIIMAGGKGTRLRPYTERCPKPMVEIAGKPMLLHIIERAKEEGIKRFVFSIHYLGHVIEDYFLDGSKYGVEISYIKENIPLGTAGALSLLGNTPDKPLLVSNGDVITDIKYGELIDFHERHQASATMAVRRHEWRHPFGVVNINGVNIVGFEEKPLYQSYINAGVYVLNPDTLSVLKNNVYCDMPMLFERLKANEKETIVYPMHEPWLDVGRPDDLDKAEKKIIMCDK